MKSITSLAILLLAMVSTPALAQDGAVHGTVLAGIATIPEYEGADRQRIIPLVGGRVMLGDRYVAIEGLSIRANLIASDHFEFGPIATLTPKRNAKIKSAAVARLGAIADAYEIGAFAALSLPVTENDRIRFSVQGVQDVAAMHKGWLATASASYIAPIGEKVRLVAELSARFADDRYARRYFSVTAAGSTASGLPEFAARGGLKDVGGSLTASYALSPRWSILGFAGYKRLVGRFADSPVVAREGRPDQFHGGLALGFSF